MCTPWSYSYCYFLHCGGMHFGCNKEQVFKQRLDCAPHFEKLPILLLHRPVQIFKVQAPTIALKFGSYMGGEDTPLVHFLHPHALPAAIIHRFNSSKLRWRRRINTNHTGIDDCAHTWTTVTRNLADFMRSVACKACIRTTKIIRTA